MMGLIPFAFAVSLMLSPDTFVIIGHLLGTSGAAGLFFILIAAAFYLGMLSYLNSFLGHKTATRGSDCFIRPITAVAHASGLWAKLISAVFLTTGLMVSAGFAFNEIFVYWFPNFGFAFLLLASLAAMQWLPLKIRIRSQVVLSMTSLLGLIVLTIAGIMKMDTLSLIDFSNTINPARFMVPDGFVFSWLIFIGPELGMVAGKKVGVPSEKIIKVVGIAVLIMAGLFALWGKVLLAVIGQARLLETTIPHILGAKALLGGTGRLIVGLMIIMGACAAVNAFLFVIQHQVKDLVDLRLLPRGFGRSKYIVSLVAMMSALLMAMGLAGHQALETLIRGCLGFWLFSYAMILLSSMKRQKAGALKIQMIVWGIVALSIWILLTAIENNIRVWIVFNLINLSVILSMAAIFMQKHRGHGL